MALEKPPSIANDPFKSAKWDEITVGRSFSQSDAPTIALLCQWYAVIERCMDDVAIDGDGLPRVAYVNDMGDIKAMPQLSTMKQASAEIRALNKQLGIKDGKGERRDQSKPTVLRVVSQNRKNRRGQEGPHSLAPRYERSFVLLCSRTVLPWSDDSMRGLFLYLCRSLTNLCSRSKPSFVVLECLRAEGAKPLLVRFCWKSRRSDGYAGAGGAQSALT